MGSLCEVKLYAPTKQMANVLIQGVVSQVEHLEKKYSRFRADSVISEINLLAGTGTTKAVDKETEKLLNYAHQLFLHSDGLFDITSGVLRLAWDFQSNRLPLKETLTETLPLIGWHQVLWHPPEIYLPKPNMEIDLGGFVKEYAADLIAEALINKGVEHGLVNLGGDLRIVGPHPDGSPWVVGVQHPRIHGAIAKVEIEQGGFATSGDYERFMLVDGKRYSHLLNPKTGFSIQPTFSSVSVHAASCLVAGSFSTIALLKSEIDQCWIDRSGVSYLKVDQQMCLSGPLAMLGVEA